MCVRSAKWPQTFVMTMRSMSKLSTHFSVWKMTIKLIWTFSKKWKPEFFFWKVVITHPYSLILEMVGDEDLKSWEIFKNLWFLKYRKLAAWTLWLYTGQIQKPWTDVWVGCMTTRQIQKPCTSVWVRCMTTGQIQKPCTSVWVGCMTTEQIQKHCTSVWVGCMTTRQIQKPWTSVWVGCMTTGQIQEPCTSIFQDRYCNPGLIYE